MRTPCPYQPNHRFLTRRVLERLCLSFLVLVTLVTAADPAEAQLNGSMIKARGITKVIAGLSDWIEDETDDSAAAAYHAVWGHDCGLLERSKYNRTAKTSWTPARCRYARSTNTCGEADSEAYAIESVYGSSTSYDTFAEANADVFTLHFQQDQHHAIGRAWASVDGKLEVWRESQVTENDPTDSAGPAVMRSGEEWPDGTVVVGALLDSVVVSIEGGSPHASSFTASLVVEGVEVWSATLTLLGDGTVDATGIPPEAYTLGYDSESDKWNVELFGYEYETSIGFLEPGESDVIDVAFLTSAKAEASAADAPGPPATMVPLPDLRQNDPDGVPMLMGEYVEIQMGPQPLLLVSGADAFLPILDTDVTDGQFAVGLIDPTVDANTEAFQPGDEIEVRGWVSQTNGRTVLVQPEIAVVGGGWDVMPFPVTLPEVELFGEDLEGMPLVFEQVELANPAEWPDSVGDHFIEVTDGETTVPIYITGFNWLEMGPAPIGTFDVIGVLSQDDEQAPYNEGYFLRLAGPESIQGATADAEEFVESNSGLELSSYPNPVTTESQLEFSLSEAGRVSLTVHDVRGRVVAVLTDGSRDAGRHRVSWKRDGGDGRVVGAGIYFVRLLAGGRSERVKMIVLD